MTPVISKVLMPLPESGQRWGCRSCCIMVLHIAIRPEAPSPWVSRHFWYPQPQVQVQPPSLELGQSPSGPSISLSSLPFSYQQSCPFCPSNLTIFLPGIHWHTLENHNQSSDLKLVLPFVTILVKSKSSVTSHQERQLLAASRHVQGKGCGKHLGQVSHLALEMFFEYPGLAMQSKAGVSQVQCLPGLLSKFVASPGELIRHYLRLRYPS